MWYIYMVIWAHNFIDVCTLTRENTVPNPIGSMFSLPAYIRLKTYNPRATH